VLRLASSSQRRRELLALLGAPFEAVAADVDETTVASPAAAKAERAASPGVVTLAADTLIDLDGERLGKPSDPEGARAMLRLLNGRDHDVRTEVALVDARGRRLRFAVRSRVRLDASDAEIDDYVASGEPLDKAGGYAIQSEGGRFVAEWSGCLANIVGLPLCHVYFALRRVGVVTPERPEAVCQERFAFRCTVWRSVHRQGRALISGTEYRSWSDGLV
jgi:MAF protein